MEIKEIEKRLKAIKWYRSFSIYCHGDTYEISVHRNRRATIQSGLTVGIQKATERAIENAKKHDEKVKEMMNTKKQEEVNKQDA